MAARAERQPNGSSNPDQPGAEFLDPEIEQIRFGDLEYDAPALVRLYTQRSVVEHLMGINPEGLTEQELIKSQSPGSRIIIAMNSSQDVLGTVTVPRPPQGFLFTEVQRLVVDERVRHHGIAKRLLRAAHSYIFSPEESGGLACTQVRAALIRDVEGYGFAFLTFEDAHYDSFSTPAGFSCKSWNSRVRDLVPRRAQWMTLDRANYRQHVRDLSRDFPAPFVPPTGIAVA